VLGGGVELGGRTSSLVRRGHRGNVLGGGGSDVAAGKMGMARATGDPDGDGDGECEGDGRGLDRRTTASPKNADNLPVRFFTVLASRASILLQLPMTMAYVVI